MSDRYDDSSLTSALRYISEHLDQRTATLFLGAGINATTRRDNGELFPLGQGLAGRISKDLLKSELEDLPLDEASEIARHHVGPTGLNRYLFDLFESFLPQSAHVLAVQLPWDAIYTTNFDLLVERAAAQGSAAGTIRPIMAAEADITSLSDDDIPYYKLHGSIDVANTQEGRLVLTKEDYANYLLSRAPLFKRLKRDLVSRCIVFLGYSLSDSNLRAILSECLQELDVASLPLSYCIRPEFTPLQEAFWRDKYNIQLIRSDGTDFLFDLQKIRAEQPSSDRTAPSRAHRTGVKLDEYTVLPRVGASYYHLIPERCGSSSNPLQFFRGAPPSWADIRDEVAPYRDAFWPLAEVILGDPPEGANAYLVTGAAGTGKTTLLAQVTWMLANDFNMVCLEHIPGTPLDWRPLGSLFDPQNPERMFLTVHHAAEAAGQVANLLHDLRAQKLPVTILLEERRNQWSFARSRVRIQQEFELGALSGEEIVSILDKMDDAGALGKLDGLSRVDQISHFEAVAKKELLVALRELTTGAHFDEIVRDEFHRIPSTIGRKAYAYVCALGLADLAIRYATILRLLAVSANDAKEQIFDPTAGVLMSHEETGSSRHNAGLRLRARHPVIASVVFDIAAPTDTDKFNMLNEILGEGDPGFPDDKRLLLGMVQRRELRETIADPHLRRRLFERLAALLPNNPMVLQHRSMLERDLREPDLAIKFAKQALSIEPHNPTFMNTLGLAYEFAARSEQSNPKKQWLMGEAERLFSEGISRDPANAYGHLGRANLMNQRIAAEQDKVRRGEMQSELIASLEDAFDATNESSIVAGELARAKDRLGSTHEAIALLDAALTNKPSDTRIRDQLINMFLLAGDLTRAQDLTTAGLRIDPGAWRLHRHQARIRRKLGAPHKAVAAAYKTAIRYKQDDVNMELELAVCLFESGEYLQAADAFARADRKLRSAHVGHSPLLRWEDADGRERWFTGNVTATNGPSGRVRAIPDNFEARFWRDGFANKLRVGDSVRFRVHFDTKGGLAKLDPRQAR